MIRIAQPTLGPEVEALVLEVLRSGRLAQGPMVQRFEGLCAEMAGSEHAIAVANGTVSLEAIFIALGIGPGDEVITTPFTFAATLNSILVVGATATFVDIGDDFNIDPAGIAAVATERTRVVLPVHLFGLPADMPAISAIADGHGWAIVEDAAQAHGASVGDRKVGGWGVGSFSFYATKNVTSGEGGCITTSDAELSERLRRLRNQGMAARYEYVEIGRNLRLTELQAAVAIPQLERLEESNRRRARNARALNELLGSIDGLELPTVPPGRTHVWHQYTVLLPERTDRVRIVELMAAAGVETGVYYPRVVWDHPPYRNHRGVVPNDTPRAVAAAACCLSLPVHASLGEGDVERVASVLIAALR